MAERKIWVLVRRYDLEDDPVEGDTVSITISAENTSNAVRNTLRNCFSITDPELILKLRNSRGSLIPINNRIDENSPETPYILEVVRVYQHVQPLERSVKLNTYTETIRTKLMEIISRIEALEAAAPELNNRRTEKIKAEMGDLDQKIEFLKKRIQQADSTQWRGMFRKNPLW